MYTLTLLSKYVVLGFAFVTLHRALEPLKWDMDWYGDLISCREVKTTILTTRSKFHSYSSSYINSLPTINVVLNLLGLEKLRSKQSMSTTP